MSKPESSVKCYIAGFHNQEIDSQLQERGFCRGMICFAVPELGVLFRCRASGGLVDLEFGAMFALLKFLKTKLAQEKIGDIKIFSSNPEFVFSFTGKSRHLEPNSPRLKLLTDYNKQFRIAVGFIDPVRNKALLSPADYPSLPIERSVSLKPDADDISKATFKPFQKGITL